jgi:hypothetical protein
VSLDAPDRTGWSSAELEPQPPPAPTPAERLNRFSPRKTGFVAGLLAALLVFLWVAGPISPLRRRSVAAIHVPPTSLAWGVRLSANQTVTALVSTPSGQQPIVVAVPTQTLVDIPGGAPTVGAAASSPGLLVATVQALLNVRLPHHLYVSETDLEALVDRLGGIQVQVGTAFLSGGQQLGPGQVKLLGTDVAAYLDEGAALDLQALIGDEAATNTTPPGELTSRWEDVLTGLLAEPHDSRLWTVPLGEGDDVSFAARILSGASGSAVIEFPTAPTDGGLSPDDKSVAAMLARFVPSTSLIRVIVLNANGEPSLGAAIDALLAPHGFRVVASQNAGTFKEPETQIIAANDGFMSRADQVMAVLGAGKVYVGAQPTGIADITIVVGKDFTPG